jgi:acetolactate synthase-1/2/3 large subunit
MNASSIMEQALRSMLSLPRGAVHVGISDNIAAAPAATFVAPRPPASPSVYRTMPGGANEDAVRRTLEVLSSARRPLLMLGNGCRYALRDPETARALACLVERWQIPVITTSDGKGVFPETHDLSLRSYGFSGCQWPQYWMTGADKKPAHDALVVVGSSLGELATYRWNPMLAPDGPFLQIDIDQSKIGRGFPITEGFVAEAGALLRALWEQAPAWPRDEDEVSARGKAIADLKSAHSPMFSPADFASESAPIHPAALCRVLSEHLPERTMFFIDCGNCVGWGLHSMTIGAGQEFHSALAMGPMGSGVCGAIGARYGSPDRPVVALVGDGALLMQVGEISTAAAYKVGVIWVVLADNRLSMVAQGMDTLFPKDPSYNQDYGLGAPDLMKVAEGLGADVCEVNRPEDLVSAWPGIVSGADRGRPQVVIARIDTEAAPPFWAPPYWQGASE